MNEYLFLLGEGFLPKKAAKIGAQNGATLVNHCDPGCGCGYGCGGDCPARKRHWFAAENRGDTINGALADTIAAALTAAKITAK